MCSSASETRVRSSKTPESTARHKSSRSIFLISDDEESQVKHKKRWRRTQICVSQCLLRMSRAFNYDITTQIGIFRMQMRSGISIYGKKGTCRIRWFTVKQTKVKVESDVTEKRKECTFVFHEGWKKLSSANFSQQDWKLHFSYFDANSAVS
jgi:hypothetical protein